MNVRLEIKKLAALMFFFLFLAGESLASSMEWVQIGQPLTPRSESGIYYNSSSNSVFLFGGRSINMLTDTWEWADGKWHCLSTDHFPVDFWGSPSLVYDSLNDRILLLGCRFSDYMFQIWELTGNDWKLIGENDSMPTQWQYFGCTYDEARNVICVFGGFNGDSLDELWEWDHNEWHQIPKAGSWPPAYPNPAMTYNSDIEKNVILIDYYDQMEIWYWDGIVWEKQTSGSSPPPMRGSIEIAYDPDRMRLVMFGGSGNRNDTWEWDGIQWYEMNPPHKPSGRMGYAFTWDGQSHRIMLFGGSTEGGQRNGETWFYDGTDWTCVLPDPFYPPDSSGYAMAFDPREQISVLYSGAPDSQMLIETFEWDGEDWTSINSSVNPETVYSHRMSFMESLDGIILYGGVSGYGDPICDKTWLYKDHTWIQLQPPVTAGPREAFMMSYDSIRDRLLLFGGITESTFYDVTWSDETWEYDGHSWSQVFPQHHPPAMSDAGMAFDNCRGVTVLFGGKTDGSIVNKTWEYNGVDWTRIDPATTSPSARRMMGFTFDSNRCRIVMHGGVANLEPGYNETWEWDGYDWYLIEPITGRAYAGYNNALVYDSMRKCSVMFGGGREGYTVETLVYRQSNPAICDQMGVTLELSQTLFHTGDTFSCTAHVCNNTGDVLTRYPLLVLLDVYGTLFWAPSFTQEFDCFLDDYPSFPEGTTDVDVLPSFAWPTNAGSAQGIRFYAALTDPAIHILIGHWDMAEFGWE